MALDGYIVFSSMIKWGRMRYESAARRICHKRKVQMEVYSVSPLTLCVCRKYKTTISRISSSSRRLTHIRAAGISNNRTWFHHIHDPLPQTTLTHNAPISNTTFSTRIQSQVLPNILPSPGWLRINFTFSFIRPDGDRCLQGMMWRRVCEKPKTTLVFGKRGFLPKCKRAYIMNM